METGGRIGELPLKAQIVLAARWSHTPVTDLARNLSWFWWVQAVMNAVNAQPGASESAP